MSKMGKRQMVRHQKQVYTKITRVTYIIHEAGQRYPLSTYTILCALYFSSIENKEINSIKQNNKKKTGGGGEREKNIATG